MSDLQETIDLGHDVREALPAVCVYVDTDTQYPNVWISNEVQEYWFQCKDVTSISGPYDLYRLTKLYRIFRNTTPEQEQDETPESWQPRKSFVW